VAASGLVAKLGFSGRIVGPGEVIFAATPDEGHYNSGGSVHGGYTATLLDTAMGCAVLTLLGADQTTTTMELKVSYHRPMTAQTGRVEATGRVLSHGRRAAFAEAKLVDAAGKLLASGTSTLMILPIQ
jgi:uncharacterized protein (TIGR00369 family)